MKTNNSEITSLVNYIVKSVKHSLNHQEVSVYIMGSLARGGFSEITSDIDLGIIIDGSLDDVEKKINQIKLSAIDNFPSVKNNISIFWGSVKSINGEIEGGRYPPFDRLDLIDHALLLSGSEVRRKLLRPSKKELLTASIKFSLNNLANKERIAEFKHCHQIAEKGVVYTTKTILFPARFIYLKQTGYIAGNKESAEYYLNNYKGSDADLIQKGYQWRLNSLPKDLQIVTKYLEKGLSKLYINYINIYIQCIDDEHQILKNKLLKWKIALQSK